MNTRHIYLAVFGMIAIAGVGLVLLSTRTPAPINAGTTLEVLYASQGRDASATLVQVSTDALSGARFVTGAANAPVTIVEFADYQCPACGVFATETEGQFKTEFIDSGKVKYAYRDFPLPQHSNAMLASQAAACAAREGQFEAMKAILFRSQNRWSEMIPERAALQFAELGAQVGASSISTCLKENANLDAINTDIEAGKRVGLQATPSFVINGYLVSGALPIEAFRAIIGKLSSK